MDKERPKPDIKEILEKIETRPLSNFEKIIRKREKLGEPKTEIGWKWRQL